MTQVTHIRDLWHSGIRVSELIGIRIQDIDFDNLAVFRKAENDEGVS